MVMTRQKEQISQPIKQQEVELLRDHTTGKAGSVVLVPASSAKMMVEDMGIAKYKGKPIEVEAEDKQVSSTKKTQNKQLKTKNKK